MASLRHPIMVQRSHDGSGMGAWPHLSLQLVHLCLDHQVNRFMGCDYNVETALAQLKTTMPMDGRHGPTGPGVRQELTVLAIIDTLGRLVLGPSAIRQHLAGERLSVLEALRWRSAPQTGMPLVALMVNPARPHRVEPRVKTRRPKSCPLMMKSRQERRQHLAQQVIRA